MFTDTGAYIGTLGKRGRMVGQLLRPIGICITKDGCVVFTDYETKCVNVFKGKVFFQTKVYNFTLFDQTENGFPLICH